MRRSVVLAAALALVGGLFTSSAHARPGYRTEATKAYPDLAKKHGMKGKLTCVLCHPSSEKSKKKRNNYGVAFGKALMSEDVGGKKNEKDAAKIKKALMAAAKAKSHVEGKTFGDLIKEVEMPGKNEAAN